MSVNSLLFKNSLELNAKSINLSGIASGLVKVAPIITTSNLLCSNLYAERALYCDQAGNIAVPSGPFTITNLPIYNYVLTGIDSSNASWQELPVQEPAQYLQTDTTAVKIFGSNAPVAGDILIALSSTEAEWGPQSGGGGNLTGPITSVGLATSIASQTGTGSTFVVQTNPSITNPTISQITNTGVLTLPTTTDTLIGRSTTDTLINKTITDNTNNIIARGLWQGSGISSVSTYAATAGVTGQVLTMNSLSTANWQTPSAPPAGNLTGPITSVGLATSIASQTGTGSTFVVQTNPSITNPSFSQITNTGVLTLPTTTDTLIGRSTTDTLINKTITNNSNNVIARGLWQGSGASSVSTYAATAGVTGQVLTLNSLTTANWQTPAAPPAGNLTGPITSVGLATSIAAQTGTGSTFVVQNSPILTTPNIGAATGTSLNVTGPLVTTIATGSPPIIVDSTTVCPRLHAERSVFTDNYNQDDLSGPIASIGLLTYITSQTGLGTTFVVQNTPILTTPDIGVATGTSLNVTGRLTSTIATGTAPLVVSSTTLVPNLYVARAVLADSATAGNLTGPITSVGLATTIAAQTGTGSTFVVQNTPTLTTPNIGAATGTSLNVSGQLTSTIATGTAPLVVSSTTNVPNLYVARSTLSDSTTTNANLTGVITSVGNATSIAAQTGTGSTFVVQTNPSITNPSFSQITNTGVLTLPTTTDTLIGRSTTDTLTNKTMTDNSNNVLSRGLWCNSGTGSVSTYASTNPISGYVLTATGVSTATWQAAASGGPTFPDNTFSIYDSTDNTKIINFDSAPATTGTTTTLTSAQTVNRIITLPDLTDTLVGRSTTDDLINKTLTDNSNNVIARGLWDGSGTGSVSTYASAAPTTGQVLVATNPTTATWQTFASTNCIITQFTANGTWTKNANTKYVQMYLMAGGGGGASGAKRLTGASGGGGGGQAGSVCYVSGPATQFASPSTVTIGTGGAGGAAQSTDLTNGNPGVRGTNTSVGAITTNFSPQVVSTGGTTTIAAGGTMSTSAYGYEAATSGAGSTGNNVASTVLSVSNNVLGWGACGGGGGSGADTVTARQASAGGAVTTNTLAILSGGAGGIRSGTINGANGAAGSSAISNAWRLVGGSGGGGGGGGTTGVAGGTGGNGGIPGGGGGGGGGGISTSSNSGAGGTGARGECWIIEYL